MSTSSSQAEDLENKEESSDAPEVPSDDDGEDVVELNTDEEETDDEMTVCDDGQETDEAPETQQPDVNASDTESDDDEVDDEEDVPPSKKTRVPATEEKVNRVTAIVKERYHKRQGRQLYIRFPEKLPEDIEEFQKKVKALSDLIVESHKPRQKHARFCLVDFANTEDRDIALKELSKIQPETKIFVSLPKTDSEDFIQTLVDKKLKQIQKKRAKNLLRKESKKNVAEKTFTTVIRVLNIPKSASKEQIKELFPDAVDIHTKTAQGKFNGKCIGTITLPSSADARKNVKRNLEMGGNKLIIQYDTSKQRNNNKKNLKAGKKPQKGPLAPPQENTPPQAKQNKNKANGAKVAENQEAPSKEVESQKPPQLPKKRSISESEASPPKKSKPEVSAVGPNKVKQGGKNKKPFPPNKNNQGPNKAKKGGKGKNLFVPQNKGNPGPNKKPSGKPNKQKNQGKKVGKGVAVTAE